MHAHKFMNSIGARRGVTNATERERGVLGSSVLDYESRTIVYTIVYGLFESDFEF